jgi:hypothetical protein
MSARKNPRDVACLECRGFHPEGRHTSPSFERQPQNWQQGEMFAAGHLSPADEPDDLSYDARLWRD